MSADDRAAAIRACRGPAELEKLLEATTYTWADIREAHEAGRQEGSENLISIAREYRDLGDSWPKAIWSTIELKVRIGYALSSVGFAIGHAGERMSS
jgi:hypothetical protein